MIEYKEQNSDSLKLYVGEEIFKPADFTVVQQSSFSSEGFDIKFGILAESHFVSIAADSLSLDELCICTDKQVGKLKPLSLTRDLNGTDYIVENDTYHYKFQVFFLKNGEASKRFEELSKKRTDLKTFHLEHVFPTKEENEPNAMTGVYISLDKGITIESIHTYPDEDLEVFTQSTLILK